MFVTEQIFHIVVRLYYTVVWLAFFLHSVDCFGLLKAIEKKVTCGIICCFTGKTSVLEAQMQKL